MKIARPPPLSFSAMPDALGAARSNLGPKMRGAPRETVLSFL
jgi:hypothetical protein